LHLNEPVSSSPHLLGEILGEVLAILNNPDGLRQLVNLPSGSAEGEIMRVLPIYFVYHYLETTGRWDIMGLEEHNSPLELKRKIREGGRFTLFFTLIVSLKYKCEHNITLLSCSTGTCCLESLAPLFAKSSLQKSFLTSTFGKTKFK
jgi:hypothetical protein